MGSPSTLLQAAFSCPNPHPSTRHTHSSTLQFPVIPASTPKSHLGISSSKLPDLLSKPYQSVWVSLWLWSILGQNSSPAVNLRDQKASHLLPNPREQPAQVDSPLPQGDRSESMQGWSQARPTSSRAIPQAARGPWVWGSALRAGSVLGFCTQARKGGRLLPTPPASALSPSGGVAVATHSHAPCGPPACSWPGSPARKVPRGFSQ